MKKYCAVTYDMLLCQVGESYSDGMADRFKGSVEPCDYGSHDLTDYETAKSDLNELISRWGNEPTVIHHTRNGLDSVEYKASWIHEYELYDSGDLEFCDYEWLDYVESISPELRKQAENAQIQYHNYLDHEPYTYYGLEEDE